MTATNLLKAEQIALKDIEDALIASGWSDGYGMTDDEVRNAPSPLFYRNSTPRSAAQSKVVIDGVGRTIYLVYSSMKPDTAYAANKPHHFSATVALTIYYSDAYTFDTGSVHARFLEGLLSELADREYVISSDGEGASAAASDREPYVYRKVIYATKIV